LYICYLDESGAVERTKTNTSHFVLLGLAIPAAAWRTKDARIASMLAAHRLSDSEIHTAWMARTYPEQERIAGFDRMSDADRRLAVTRERKADLAKAQLRGKNAVQTLARNYRKSDAYVHLTHAERLAVLRAIADEVGTWSDARIFADAQKKAATNPKVPDEKILDYAFGAGGDAPSHVLGAHESACRDLGSGQQPDRCPAPDDPHETLPRHRDGVGPDRSDRRDPPLRL
jgi:hypothetical protein